MFQIWSRGHKNPCGGHGAQEAKDAIAKLSHKENNCGCLVSDFDACLLYVVDV